MKTFLTAFIYIKIPTTQKYPPVSHIEVKKKPKQNMNVLNNANLVTFSLQPNSLHHESTAISCPAV